MEVYVDDETKLTLHGLQQYYCKLKDSEKNRKLFDLLDVLEFNQVWLKCHAQLTLYLFIYILAILFCFFLRFCCGCTVEFPRV